MAVMKLSTVLYDQRRVRWNTRIRACYWRAFRFGRLCTNLFAAARFVEAPLAWLGEGLWRCNWKRGLMGSVKEASIATTIDLRLLVFRKTVDEHVPVSVRFQAAPCAGCVDSILEGFTIQIAFREGN